MAVYKATYCYPFLTAYDTRVEYDPDSPQVKWFSCKVDTSNKDVTGYKISVLDENIFLQLVNFILHLMGILMF